MASGDDRVTVWWIDDDHVDHKGERQGERTALVKQAGDNLNLVAIHPAEFDDYKRNLENRPAPDLLLIDFRLGSVRHPTKLTPFFAKDGITLRGATFGIEGLKDAPAYLVSRVTQRAQVGSSDDHFDWVLSHQQLMDELGGGCLLTDAQDYRQLRKIHAAASEHDDRTKVQHALVTAIIDLLRVPVASVESVRELVSNAIATLLRAESSLDSDEMKLAPCRPRAIARWVRSDLQKRRGPLIDELNAANMLGTTLEYFTTKLRTKLNLGPVTYTGIFQRTTSMTLWRDAFLRYLHSESQSIRLSSPAILAQSAAKYFEVPEVDQSVCRVCKKRWPEVIAFDEDDPSVEAAIHWRCSKEATDIDSVFGFDIPRSFGD